MMSPEAKQRIQLALLLALVVAGVRAGYILYERHEDNAALEKKKQAQDAGYANADYYVNPKKLYPYDLKSARQLTQQPVWVKEGYRYAYYRYDRSDKKVDFAQNAGVLLPIEKQVMGVFQKEGQTYAVPIGYEAEEQYKIYSDEMFFVEDPHDLYKHWPADIWQAVEQHQVKPGMNELQADFAIGMGVPDAGSGSDEKTVRYPNGGKPVVVVYHEGKAADIKAGSPGS
jgi:hypothetical protein